MKRWVSSGLTVAFLLALAAPALAGHPQKREGFWIGFGFGYGSASIGSDSDGCDGCDNGDRQGSFTGFLKLGGTLSPKFLLGGEVNAWGKEEDDVTLTLGSVTGTVTFYPQETGGLFVKGGLGFSFVDLSSQFGSTTISTSKSGWGVLAGIGYDVRIGKNLSLTPSVNYWYGKPGDLDIEGTRLTGFKHNVVSFDLGLTFH